MITKIDYTIEEIFDHIHGEWLLKTNNAGLDFLSLDSRKISDPSNTIFWAISSESRKGSDYIKELYQKGVRNFVTQDKLPVKNFRGANLILVKNSVEALQRLAQAHRKKYKHIHVIGITGSNGKTVVKEWLNELLSGMYSVIKSPRSYNSQIGVPLSVLQIRDFHQVGIFEAGISKPGEMKKLQKIIQPETGIFTNIGQAHDVGFHSRSEKIQEKLLLFKRCKTFIYPGNQAEIGFEINEMKPAAGVQKMSWGKNGDDFKVGSEEKALGQTEITIVYKKEQYRFDIPFTDKASVENAASCFAAIIASGLYQYQILKKFRDLHPVSMRLEIKPGINHCVVINDSYSNDLQSLQVAIDFLNQQNSKHNTVILSDLLQSGISTTELYHQVANLLQRGNVRRLIAVGQHISAEKDQFSKIPFCHFFPDTTDIISHWRDLEFQDETILVKGARKFSFEKISSLLEAQVHQTVLSVNLSNLSHNIRIFKSLLKPGTKLMAMVKAFAYGTGSSQIASLLQFVKADYLAVAFADEGIALRNAGITLPVMVLNVEQPGFDALVKYQLEPEIFSLNLLKSFTGYLKRKNIFAYPIHLKMDTGMHRLGIDKNEIRDLLPELANNRHVSVKSAFSHLSSSDNSQHDDFSKKQFHLFKKMTKQLKTVIQYPFDCHLSNTSAIRRFPEFQMDMVRLGIGMYGIDSDPGIMHQLKVVNRLSTTISQIRKVKSGEVVGYGKNVMRKDRTIATVGIGYADGYPRLLGNGKGKMMLHGKTVSTVGNICMDMTMLDVSEINNAREGDEVIVFGESLPVQRVAKWASTIPYEILTSISPRVKRVYFEE